MNFIIMGVCGSGKSTIGQALSRETGIPFIDGDDLHSRRNILRMAKGRPLSDRDRIPWLKRIGRTLRKYQRRSGVIIACSALKQSYRDILSLYSTYSLVYLEADREVIVQRLRGRQNHFMPEELIESQFEALEEPAGESVISVAVELPLDDQIKEIRESCQFQVSTST